MIASFDIHEWNKKRYLNEDYTSDISQKVDILVQNISNSISKKYNIPNDQTLSGTIRFAIGDAMDKLIDAGLALEDLNLNEIDLHEWNKKRYLGELEIDQEDDNVNQDNEDGSLNITRGGDDPKIGAELEAGVIGDRVAENKSHLEFLAKYLNSMHPELTWEVKFGERVDAYGSQSDLRDFGNKYHGKKFGDYEVFHVDDDDRKDIVSIVKSSSIGKNQINEAYEPKHFDICPGAQALRKRVVDGEFGSTEEFDLDKWTKLHDALFGLEKKVLRDKEAEDSDVNLAEKLRSEIINLSRDINIPAEAIGYLKGHVDIIRDISDYSALTEENND